MIEIVVFSLFIVFVFALIMNRPPTPGQKYEIAMWDAKFLEDKELNPPRNVPLFLRGWRTPEITPKLTEFGDQHIPLYNPQKGHRGVSMKRMVELLEEHNHHACLTGPARRIFREKGNRGLINWFLGGVPAEVRPWFHVRTEIGCWLVSDRVTSPFVFVSDDSVVLICGPRNKGGIIVKLLWPDEMRRLGVGQSGSSDALYALGEPRDDEGVFVKMYPGDELRIPEGFGYRVGGVGDGMRVCLFLTMNHPASLVRHYLVPYTFRRLKGVLPEDYKSLHYTPKEDKDGSKEVTEGD